MGGLNPLSPLCVHHCHQRQLPPFIAVYTLTDPLRQRPFRSLPTTTNRHDGHRLSTTAFVRTPHRYTQQVLRPMATPTNNPASTDHRVVSYLQCTPSLSLSLDTCSWCPVCPGLATRTRPPKQQTPVVWYVAHTFPVVSLIRQFSQFCTVAVTPQQTSACSSICRWPTCPGVSAATDRSITASRSPSWQAWLV